jgi:hypothetical protein
MSRPSFATTVAALRTRDSRFPWVGPTDEEDDIAAVLEAIEETHLTLVDEPDHRGRYGRCADCRQPWPCPEWMRGEQLAVLYLGRAADRVIAHARQAFDRRTA